MVNVYIEISARGPKRNDTAYGYILETMTQKGAATLTKIGMLLNVTEHQAFLQATIEAVERVKPGTEIVVFMDSEYVAAALNNGWVHEWQKNEWKNSKGKPVANKEEWQNLLNLLGEREFSIQVQKEHEYKNWLENEVRKESKKNV